MVEAVRAKRSLGQHFLTDDSYCGRIVSFLGPQETDTIVEIGPGTGQLTVRLLGAAKRVIAIELDSDLIRLLKQRFPDELAGGQLTLEQGDVLQFKWLQEIGHCPKVVGNLPYNIATRILTKTADIATRFHSLTVMLQKEVAERILASPGESDYGYLSVLLQLHFECEPGFDVPPGAFTPRPRVQSHVLKLTPLVATLENGLRRRVLSLASLAFRHPRKTLRNNLKGSVEPEALDRALDQLQLSDGCRPGQISPGQYVALAELL